MRDTFTFLSADGRTQIHAFTAAPEQGEIRGVLQITHGMVEYIDRYEPFVRYLLENGFAVAGMDLLGHGASAVSEEEWGYFAPEDPGGVLVEDMQKLRMLAQEKFSGKPYFMFGHSMGSYLLRRYLASYGEGLSGAIICGTGYVDEKTTRLGLFIVHVIAAFRGWHYRSRFIQNLSFGKSYKAFDLTGKEPERSWLTKDTEIVRRYYSDPRCTFRFTLNGYRGLMETVQFDCRQENVNRIPWQLPVLIISGAEDPVGDLGEGVRKTADMFSKAGIPDLTCILQSGDRHEILNELDKEKVFACILDWMEKRLIM